MERSCRAKKWLRSVYIVYGIVFVGVLGGLVQILEISDRLNYGLVRLLQFNSQGPELHGRYLFPEGWLDILIICLSLMLLFPVTALLKSFVNEGADGNEQKTPEIIGLRQDLDDVMRYAGNITGYIYSKDDKYTPRLNISQADVKFKINEDGDTDAEIVLELKCTENPAHFYIHWIRADPESGEVKFLRQLSIQAFDLDSNHKLDWLPLRNDTTAKALAVFFPELRPGTRKRIKLVYRWPRFMAKLVDLGATNFDWAYLSQNPTIPAHFRTEWIFDSSFAPLDCRIVGRAAETAKIRLQQNGPVFSWMYEDEAAFLNAKCAVEFVRAGR